MAQGYAAQTLLTPTTEDVSDVFDKVNKHLESAVRKKVAIDVNEEQKKSDAEKDRILYSNDYGIYNPYNKGDGDSTGSGNKLKQGQPTAGDLFNQGNEIGKKVIEQKTELTKEGLQDSYDAELAKLHIENETDLALNDLWKQTLANSMGNAILNNVAKFGFNANTMGLNVGSETLVKFLPNWLRLGLKGTGVALKGVAPAISAWNLKDAIQQGDEVGIYKHGAQTAAWTASALTTQGAFSGSLAGAAGLGAGLGFLAADTMDYLLKRGALKIENAQTQAMAEQFSDQFTESYVKDYIQRQIDQYPEEKEELKKEILKASQTNKELSDAIQRDGIDNIVRNNLALGIIQDKGHIDNLKLELFGTKDKPGYLSDVVKDLSDATNQGSSRGYYGLLWLTDIDKSARRSEMQGYLDMVPIENNPLMQAYSKAKEDYINYTNAEYKDPNTEQELKTKYQLAERKAYFKLVENSKKETDRIIKDDRFSLDQKKRAIINTLKIQWLTSSAGDTDIKDINDYGYWNTMGEGLSNFFTSPFK